MPLVPCRICSPNLTPLSPSHLGQVGSQLQGRDQRSKRRVRQGRTRLAAGSASRADRTHLSRRCSSALATHLAFAPPSSPQDLPTHPLNPRGEDEASDELPNLPPPTKDLKWQVICAGVERLIEEKSLKAEDILLWLDWQVHSMSCISLHLLASPCTSLNLAPHARYFRSLRAPIGRADSRSTKTSRRRSSRASCRSSPIPPTAITC